MSFATAYLFSVTTTRIGDWCVRYYRLVCLCANHKATATGQYGLNGNAATAAAIAGHAYRLASRRRLAAARRHILLIAITQ